MHGAVNAARMAGQLLSVPQLAALAGLVYGVPAVASYHAGKQAGTTNPQYGGLVGTVGAGLAGGVTGGIIGAPLNAIAYNRGHHAGRQYATDYMLGPGHNASHMQWQQIPGTGNMHFF